MFLLIFLCQIFLCQKFSQPKLQHDEGAKHQDQRLLKHDALKKKSFHPNRQTTFDGVSQVVFCS